MRLFVVTLLSLIFTLSAHAANDSSDWELETEEEDIQLKIFTREISGSNLKAFKGEMIVSAKLSSLASLLLDSNAAPDWMHQCEKFEIIEQLSPQNAVIYFINGAPWPVSDRDAVISTVMSQNPETLDLRIDVKALVDRLPEDEDYVRIPRMIGFWSFSPMSGGDVKVVYQVHAEPGGSLPAWLANSVVVDTPYHTLSNMRDMLVLEKYKQAELSFVKNVQ